MTEDMIEGRNTPRSRQKPPFPGTATKHSVIPAMIEILKRHNLPYEHLLTIDTKGGRHAK